MARERFVFISHCGRDTWVARQIAREVAACGAQPFLDEAHIQVGEDFEEQLRTWLERAHELLVYLTPWALERPYIWIEMGVAFFRGIPVVAVLHGLTAADLQSRPEIPVLLKRRDLIEINELDTYLRQLKARVERGIMEGGGFDHAKG
ncbi:MAG: toll/interleukin-1 receptor domain-containing protein [Acidobacteria bacterium]|nr:toll/interleukin-1 receptor domain-containing protein [Acidobacteriota bacterium]